MVNNNSTNNNSNININSHSHNQNKLRARALLKRRTGDSLSGCNDRAIQGLPSESRRVGFRVEG